MSAAHVGVAVRLKDKTMANLNLFTHPGTFRRINLKFIHEWLAPHRDYLGQRGFTLASAVTEGPVDYERLAAVFMEPDAAMPRQLMHSVALIHEMANEDAMTALLEGARQRNIPLEVGDDPDPADVAVQMWLKDPDLLEELHQLHQLDRPRGFVHFVTDRDPIPAFREPTDVQTAELEAALASGISNTSAAGARGCGCIGVRTSFGFCSGMVWRADGKKYCHRTGRTR